MLEDRQGPHFLGVFLTEKHRLVQRGFSFVIPTFISELGQPTATAKVRPIRVVRVTESSRRIALKCGFARPAAPCVTRPARETPRDCRLRNSASFGEADLVTACLSGVEKPLRQTNHTQQARGARQAVNRSAGF